MSASAAIAAGVYADLLEVIESNLRERLDAGELEPTGPAADVYRAELDRLHALAASAS